MREAILDAALVALPSVPASIAEVAISVAAAAPEPAPAPVVAVVDTPAPAAVAPAAAETPKQPEQPKAGRRILRRKEQD